MQPCMARLLSGKLSLDLLELQNRFKIKTVGLVGAAHSLVTIPVTIAQSSTFGRSGVQECERRGSGKVSGDLWWAPWLWVLEKRCSLHASGPEPGLAQGRFRLVSRKALTALFGCLRCGRQGGCSAASRSLPRLIPGSLRILNTVSHKDVYSQRQEKRFVLSESEAIFLTSLCVPESGVPVPGATHGRPASPSSG